MTIDEIKEKLTSKKSSDRLRAAKMISKNKIAVLADELLVSYIKEKQDVRTWEPQSEMIKALGLLDHKPAFVHIEPIVRINIPHDMITLNASVAFVQLKRKSIYDAQPVLELLNFGSTSVISGALEVLAIDKMLPTDKEIQEIIKTSWDINKHKDRIGYEFGLLDPRIYLAVACAGWDKTLTEHFLHHCIETAYDINRFGDPVKNIHLIDACEKALKGKYKSM